MRLSIGNEIVSSYKYDYTFQNNNFTDTESDTDTVKHYFLKFIGCFQ